MILPHFNFPNQVHINFRVVIEEWVSQKNNSIKILLSFVGGQPISISGGM